MMETQKITFDVIPAKDLSHFTHESGKRLLNEHFFIKGETEWQFRWIEESTDIDWLKAKIAEGRIYVFKD